MSSESAPGKKTSFEETIVEVVDTGYTGPVSKQVGREKITLAEFSELLGDKAPSSKIIDELGLLTKELKDLGPFTRTSNPSELLNQTVFLGTKHIDKDGKVWFKTFNPATQAFDPRGNFYTYTSADAESKYYGIAVPEEMNKETAA